VPYPCGTLREDLGRGDSAGGNFLLIADRVGNRPDQTDRAVLLEGRAEPVSPPSLTWVSLFSSTKTGPDAARMPSLFPPAKPRLTAFITQRRRGSRRARSVR
jgi:hypothetical protein